MMCDSETWLVNVDERVDQLDRVRTVCKEKHPLCLVHEEVKLMNGSSLMIVMAQVAEKHLHIMDDLEQCQKEAGSFMEQHDDEILVSDRPRRHLLSLMQPGQAKESGKYYLLNRFFNDSRESTAAANLPRASIRSMQHFFLKVR